MATPATGPANQPTISFGPYYSAPGGLDGVGFGLRALARIIDHVVFYVVTFLSSLSVGLIIGIVAAIRRRALPADLGTVSWHIYLAAFLAYVLYHSICEGLHGSTLGKLICGIVVISENGERCGVKAAVGRSLAYFVDSLVFGIVAYLSMKDSREQQRLGDKWNDTMVVKRHDVAPKVLRSGSHFAIVFVTATFLQALIIVLSLVPKLFF
jgi:uncharacterized RDD family membrane protein YckC